jgi:hypothetical protein
MTSAAGNSTIFVKRQNYSSAVLKPLQGFTGTAFQLVFQNTLANMLPFVSHTFVTLGAQYSLCKLKFSNLDKARTISIEISMAEQAGRGVSI